jgi:hypothetical protein
MRKIKNNVGCISLSILALQRSFKYVYVLAPEDDRFAFETCNILQK